jgi:hypothetical protein
MTLSRHVLYLKIGIVVSALAAAALAAVSWKILPVYADLVENAVKHGGRASAHFTFFSGGIFVFISTLLGLLYALAGQLLIYYFFEKTQSLEIRFLSIFVFSFVFELTRIILPLQAAWELPGSFNEIAARILMFGRFFGLFSLFAASLCLSGLKSLKEENLIVGMMIISVLIAAKIPVNILEWDSSLTLVTGYTAIFKSLEIVVVILAMCGFFISTYKTKVLDYLHSGLGLLCAVIGRTFLIHGYNLISLILGVLFLGFGTWWTGFHIRRIYLWL